MMFPLVLYPPSFEAVYCYICSRRMWLLLNIGWFVFFLWNAPMTTLVTFLLNLYISNRYRHHLLADESRWPYSAGPVVSDTNISHRKWFVYTVIVMQSKSLILFSIVFTLNVCSLNLCVTREGYICMSEGDSFNYITNIWLEITWDKENKKLVETGPFMRSCCRVERCLLSNLRTVSDIGSNSAVDKIYFDILDCFTFLIDLLSRYKENILVPWHTLFYKRFYIN